MARIGPPAHLRDTLALEHVTDEHRIDVALQQLGPEPRRKTLCFGKAAFGEELGEALFDVRAFGSRPAAGLGARLLAPMAQELAKAKRADHRLHTAPAQRAVHLGREHARRVVVAAAGASAVLSCSSRTGCRVIGVP